MTWNPHKCHLGPSGAACCYTLGCLISAICGADSHLQPCIPVHAAVLGGETHCLALACGDIRSGFFARAPVGPLYGSCVKPGLQCARLMRLTARCRRSVAPVYCGDPPLFESLKGVCSPRMQSMVVLRICTMWLSVACNCRAVQLPPLRASRGIGVSCPADLGQGVCSPA